MRPRSTTSLLPVPLPWLLVSAHLLSSSLAGAASGASPAVVATCDEGRIELTFAGGTTGGAELRATVSAPDGQRWSFTARTSIVHVGRRTRTIGIEQITSRDGTRAPGAAAGRVPSQLWIDLILDDKMVALRHGSESARDPAIALDLGNCNFPGDDQLARLEPTDGRPAGCGAEVIKKSFLPRVTSASSLAPADAREQAALLCAAHDKMLAAHHALDAEVSDTIARRRATERGKALRTAEEQRVKAFELADACLTFRHAATTAARGVPALMADEDNARRCYEGLAIALRPSE